MKVTSLFEVLPACARLFRSQRWPAARLEALQRERLDATLRSAWRVPFYKQFWSGEPRLDDFATLPIVRREDVQKLLDSVKSLHQGPFESDNSSGSTGMRAEFLFDRPHQRGRFAARARYLLTHGWTPWARSAWIIYIPEGTPDGRLVRSRFFAGSRFLSTFTDFDEQAAWLRRLDPVFLYTLPSNLDTLLGVLEGKGPLRSLRLVLCGGEVVEEDLRRRTREILGVEIADNYGSTEAFLAWQCPQGRYHLNAEHALVEILDEDGRRTEPGRLGRVIVTTLENRLMPLVRYEIGDWAEAAGGSCACGRTLPLIQRVAGRSVTLFRLRDGRLLSPYDLIVRVKHRDGVKQFQLVQRAVDLCVLRYVGDGPLRERTAAEIRRDAVEALGEGVGVEFERVDRIERSPTGKFMTAISEVSSGRMAACT